MIPNHSLLIDVVLKQEKKTQNFQIKLLILICCLALVSRKHRHTNSSEVLLPEGLTAEVTQFPEELGTELASFLFSLTAFNNFCIFEMGFIKIK